MKNLVVFLLVIFAINSDCKAQPLQNGEGNYKVFTYTTSFDQTIGDTGQVTLVEEVRINIKKLIADGKKGIVKVAQEQYEKENFYIMLFGVISLFFMILSNIMWYKEKCSWTVTFNTLAAITLCASVFDFVALALPRDASLNALALGFFSILFPLFVAGAWVAAYTFSSDGESDKYIVFAIFYYILVILYSLLLF